MNSIYDDVIVRRGWGGDQFSECNKGQGIELPSAHSSNDPLWVSLRGEGGILNFCLSKGSLTIIPSCGWYLLPPPFGCFVILFRAPRPPSPLRMLDSVYTFHTTTNLQVVGC